ncbi:MAG: hypothetical protein ABJI96_05080 [Paracoccaceae bacterium]
MDILKATEHAQALYNAHGDKAEYEAARRQKQSEEAGDSYEAKNWKSIRAAVRRLRGPIQS